MRLDYAPRPIRPLGVQSIGEWRIKVYSISSEDEVADAQLISAALDQANQALHAPTAQEHYGVGFLGIHDGAGENQVFLDRWINGNELMHQCWISSKESPGELRKPDADHNSVCVWDLFVQGYEREAWLRHVLDNSHADIEAYLADSFLGNA